MTYTPPANNAVNFALKAYTAPSYSAVSFELGDVISAFGKVVISEIWKSISAMQVCISETWKPVTKVQVCISETWKDIV